MRNTTLKSMALASTLVLAGISGTAMANESEQNKEVQLTLEQQIDLQAERVSAELQQQLQASLKQAIARFVPELPSTVLAKNN